jgi:hypothetical protein
MLRRERSRASFRSLGSVPTASPPGGTSQRPKSSRNLGARRGRHGRLSCTVDEPHRGSVDLLYHSVLFAQSAIPNWKRQSAVRLANWGILGRANDSLVSNAIKIGGKMKFPTHWAVLFLVCGGCSASPTSEKTGSATAASTVISCSMPAGANTYDGSAGCQAQPATQDCTVTSGASVSLDGAVTNGTATCTSACPPHQFYLACTGPLGTVGTAPAPDPSLSCTNAGGPSGSNERDYCCACSE